MTAKELFEFCSQNLKGIKYIYVDEDEVKTNECELQIRFKDCLKVKGTRSFHKIVPISENKIRCFKTSISVKYEEILTSKTVTLALQEEDIIACVYDGKWWLGKIKIVSLEHNDFFVHFYEPAGPRTSFKLSRHDEAWVPLHKVLRKLTPVELTTVTGRNYNNSQHLCEEISQLLNAHQL